jgi:hypothetical protein
VRVNPSTNQADVDWDNGRQLMLLLDVDPFQVMRRSQAVSQRAKAWLTYQLIRRRKR